MRYFQLNQLCFKQFQTTTSTLLCFLSKNLIQLVFSFLVRIISYLYFSSKTDSIDQLFNYLILTNNLPINRVNKQQSIHYGLALFPASVYFSEKFSILQPLFIWLLLHTHFARQGGIPLWL